MARLSLRLLGSPQIERYGLPIEVDTRKATALLAYLAVTRDHHSRDALAELLWPESDATRARAALRRTLSALNKALHGEGMRTDRRSVGISLGPNDEVDVDQFRALLAECRTHGHGDAEVCTACPPPLEQAAELFRDDFLAGFSLRDSPSFDEWQFFESETLRRELEGALDRLILGYAGQGEFPSAIAHARRRLALDPLRESAHRQLMRLYSWSGERNAALRQYRECVRVLERELGVPPLPETNEVYESVKGDNVPNPPSTPEPRTEAVRPTQQMAHLVGAAERPGIRGRGRTIPYPFVGRVEELRALLGAYDAIAEDGIGKTRLAEVLLDNARSQGSTTLGARSYQGESGLAYGPILEWLRSAVSSPDSRARTDDLPSSWVAEAARLLPELESGRQRTPPAAPLDTPGAQARFFEGISRVLVAASGDGGVLFLDDVHWADEASLEMLNYLVRRLASQPMCILVTWRSEAVPAGHPLRAMLAESHRAGAATHIVLPRLETSEVAELARSTGIEIAADTASELHLETEGLPFFVVEYLAAAPKEAPDGPIDAWAVPSSVRDLLASRLSAVSETGRQLLNAAAVIGRSFSFDIVREASGRGDEEAVEALEELIDQRLIGQLTPNDGDGEPDYDFSHERLRALVQEETSLARRRLLHRRIATALVARARGGSHASQIARHYQLAGQEDEAGRYHKLAGEYARSLYANAEAVSHFESALALGHPDVAELHVALGDLRTLSGEYTGAFASYEAAAARAGEADLPNVEHKLGMLCHRRGEWDLAESYFQSALSALPDEGADGERARLCADLSLTAHQSGRPADALDFARRALEVAETAEDVPARAQARNIMGILAKSRGDLDDAVEHSERSLALAETLADSTGARVAALNNLALACGAKGHLDRAIALDSKALELCVPLGDRHREAALLNNMSDLLYAAGRPDDAMAHLKQAVAIFAEIGEDAGSMQPEIWKLAEW